MYYSLLVSSSASSSSFPPVNRCREERSRRGAGVKCSSGDPNNFSSAANLNIDAYKIKQLDGLAFTGLTKVDLLQNNQCHNGSNTLEKTEAVAYFLQSSEEINVL